MSPPPPPPPPPPPQAAMLEQQQAMLLQEQVELEKAVSSKQTVETRFSGSTVYQLVIRYTSLKLMPRFGNLSIAGPEFRYKRIHGRPKREHGRPNRSSEDPYMINCTVFQKLRYVQSQRSSEETFQFAEEAFQFLEEAFRFAVKLRHKRISE